MGGRGVLCAPTAHRTNGINGVSAETEYPRNLESIIGLVRPGNYRRNYSRFQKSSTKNSSKSENIAPLPDRRGPIQTQKRKTMINKQQLAALVKAVEEGGDDDDEITEDEAIAILRDTGLDAEIPSVRERFAWERSQKRPQ